MRHAGLGHLLLGRGQVQLQAGSGRLVVRHLRREQRVGRLAVAEQDRLDQGLPVDRQRDRPAHVHVLERLVQLVESQVVGLGGVEQVHVDALRGLQAGHCGPGGELVDLRLAALELQLPGVVVRDVGPGDAVQVRQPLLPVERVPDQLERLALVPEAPLERAGADRVGVELVLGLAAVVVRHDPVGEDRQVGEQRRPRELEVDDDGLGRGRVHRLDGRVQVGPALRRLAVLVDRELHVRGRQRLAVGELDAGPEGEGVGLLVRRDLVAGRERGLHALAVVGHGVELLEDLLEDPDRVVVEYRGGVHRLRVLNGREDEIAAVHRAAAGAVGAACRRSTRRPAACHQRDRADGRQRPRGSGPVCHRSSLLEE